MQISKLSGVLLWGGFRYAKLLSALSQGTEQNPKITNFHLIMQMGGHMEGINQQLIRSSNLRWIYRLIDENISISRAKLASTTKLSKTTVSSLVDELISGGYVVDCGTAPVNQHGRKPNILHINSTGNVVAVISWRRTRLDIALVTADSRCLLTDRIPLHRDDDGVQRIAQAFFSMLLPAIGSARLLGVCLVIPGIVDRQRQCVLSTVVGVDFSDPIIPRLRQAFGDYPLCILNDTACFAYAESTFTRIQEPFFAYINMSKGVGACLFADGKMLRGAGAMATQFGHFSIDRSGPQCRCGNRGCLEAMVGETALPARAAACGLDAELVGGRRILYSDVGHLAQTGNECARRLLQELAQDMAFAISNLISVFNPSLIIIGGTGVNLGPLFLKEIRSALSRMGFQEFVQHVTLRYAELGLNSEFTGAAQYYINHHYDFTNDMRGQLFLG